MSVLKAWLIITASLIDDAIIFGLIFLGLWLFHIEITWVLVIIVIVVMAVFVIIMHKAVVPAIQRRIVVGAEDMVGKTCIVTEALRPTGMIKIKGEFWKAEALDGIIKAGEEVEVVGIKGLVLQVRKKKQ